MTDAERLEELLKAWDVPHEVRSSTDAGTLDGEPGIDIFVVTAGDSRMLFGHDSEERYEQPARKWNGTPDKATGYGAFYTRFEFDAAGTFRRMGAWE